MSAAYGIRTPDRAQILRDAHIVTADDVGSSVRLANMLALADACTEWRGHRFYLLTWPNGIIAFVIGEPEAPGWEDLLVVTYQLGLQNRIGSVVLGE